MVVSLRLIFVGIAAGTSADTTQLLNAKFLPAGSTGTFVSAGTFAEVSTGKFCAEDRDSIVVSDVSDKGQAEAYFDPHQQFLEYRT